MKTTTWSRLVLLLALLPLTPRPGAQPIDTVPEMPDAPETETIRPRENGAPEAPHVNFNFEQVELRHLVNVVGAQTGRRLIMDDALTGKVTVITRDTIPMDQVFPLFLAVLEGSGFTVVEREGAYHIRQLGGMDPMQAPVVGADHPLSGIGLITRVIRLNHVRATDVRPMLEPMVRRAQEGALSAFGPTNHLVITDTASNIQRIETLLEELDRPGQSTSLTVIPLKHASARDLSAQISAALLGAESAADQMSRRTRAVIEGRGDLPAGFTIVPAEQANALIVSAGPLQLTEIRSMVEQLDVPPESAATSGRLHAVFLNYLSAESAATQLTELLGQRREGDARDAISVGFDTANNAVLVDASPLAFAGLRELLKDLDRPPQQVLVEVLIVEVAENSGLDLGVEWSTTEQPRDGTTTVIGRSRPGETDAVMDLARNQAFPQGLSFGLARGALTLPDGTVVPNLAFFLQALQTQRDVNILSNVPLRTQNNAEATVSVVENIPILRSTIEAGAGTNRDVIQNIDRIDVGIKLTVRPQVNPNREITLQLNPSIEAIIREAVPGTQLTPTIARREVKSTLTTPEGVPVIISGLLREDTNHEVRKVPVLGSIPLIGHLFRSTTARKQKTNLLIIVTPYIVTEEAEGQEAARRWENRTGLSTGSSLPAVHESP